MVVTKRLVTVPLSSYWLACEESRHEDGVAFAQQSHVSSSRSVAFFYITACCLSKNFHCVLSFIIVLSEDRFRAFLHNDFLHRSLHTGESCSALDKRNHLHRQSLPGTLYASALKPYYHWRSFRPEPYKYLYFMFIFAQKQWGIREFWSLIGRIVNWGPYSPSPDFK